MIFQNISLYKILRERQTAKPEKLDLSFVQNWLKHGTFKLKDGKQVALESMRITPFLAVFSIQRAITKFAAVYGGDTPQMAKFIKWCKGGIPAQARGRASADGRCACVWFPPTNWALLCKRYNSHLPCHSPSVRVFAEHDPAAIAWSGECRQRGFCPNPDLPFASGVAKLLDALGRRGTSCKFSLKPGTHEERSNARQRDQLESAPA